MEKKHTTPTSMNSSHSTGYKKSKKKYEEQTLVGSKRPINGKKKGSVGELEAAKRLHKLFGWEARRRQQYCGKNGTDDVDTGIPELHTEIKRSEQLRFNDWIPKMINDCGTSCPFIMFRTNRKTHWLITWLSRDRNRFLQIIRDNTVPTRLANIQPHALFCEVEKLSTNPYQMLRRIPYGISATCWTPGKSYRIDIVDDFVLQFLAHNYHS